MPLALLALLVVAVSPASSAAQVILRPGPAANQSGVTVVEPTFEPPYRLTVTIYVTARDGSPVPPGLGANLLLIDAQGRRAGMDESCEPAPRSRPCGCPWLPA